MKDTITIMNDFMQELSKDVYVKDCQPNDGPDITKEFLGQKLKEYSDLLDSGVVKAALQN